MTDPIRYAKVDKDNTLINVSGVDQDLDMKGNDILNVGTLQAVNIIDADLFDQTLNTTDSVAFAGLDMTTNDITNVNEIFTNNINDVSGGEVNFNARIQMNNREIQNVSSIAVENITDRSGTGKAIIPDGGDEIVMTNNTVFRCNQLEFNQITPSTPNTGIFGLYNNSELLYKIDDTGSLKKLEFDQSLDTTDSVTFDSITITNDYGLVNVNPQRSSYVIPSLAVSANTDTVLTNWDTVVSSSRVSVDPITGTFSPVAGLYSMTYQAVIATTANATRIGARLVDDLGNTTYLSVVETFDLFESETGWEGAQFENLVAYFDGTRTYQIHCKINGNETMTIQVEISRLL